MVLPAAAAYCRVERNPRPPASRCPNPCERVCSHCRLDDYAINRALTLLRRLIDYGKLARCLISLLVAPGDQLRRVFAYNSFINESIAFARSRTQRSGLF
jgi:hypothetical protein